MLCPTLIPPYDRVYSHRPNLRPWVYRFDQSPREMVKSSCRTFSRTGQIAPLDTCKDWSSRHAGHLQGQVKSPCMPDIFKDWSSRHTCRTFSKTGQITPPDTCKDWSSRHARHLQGLVKSPCMPDTCKDRSSRHAGRGEPHGHSPVVVQIRFQ